MENHGVIGVFVRKDGTETRCSISIRATQSKKELEEQVRREHPNVNISLRRMYTFSCKRNVVDIEVGLRKILHQTFKSYTPSVLGWESYVVDNVDTFMEYVKTIIYLIDSIIVVQEMH